jgi:hypothetical protein
LIVEFANQKQEAGEDKMLTTFTLWKATFASTPITGIPTVWIIAPTIMIEDNAFVTAISGVCNAGVTPQTT